MSIQNKIKTPLIAVDGIVLLYKENVFVGMVAIERKNPPFGLALPGGFVDVGESCESAVVREMKEELSLDTELVKMFGVYSEPERDPRGHVISVVYILKSDGIPVAKDDAKAIKIIGLNNFENFDFAFDHKKIIKDYVLSLI